jgi:hypothetical protein
MNTTRYAALALLLIGTATTQAQTSVPHVFQSGQPARASDVNQNFNALATITDQNAASVAGVVSRVDSLDLTVQEQASSIQTLEGQVTALQSSNTADCDVYFGVHQPDYVPVEAAPGTQLTIAGDSNYYMVRVPFVEYSSGQRFVIDLPVHSDDARSGTLVSFSHSPPVDPDCYQVQVSGFPAVFRTFDSRVYNWQGEPFRELRASTSAGPYIQIFIGETSIYVRMRDYRVSPETLHASGSPVYDYTNLLNTDEMLHPDAYIDAVDQLVDYIRITPWP